MTGVPGQLSGLGRGTPDAVPHAFLHDLPRPGRLRRRRVRVRRRRRRGQRLEMGGRHCDVVLPGGRLLPGGPPHQGLDPLPLVEGGAQREQDARHGGARAEAKGHDQPQDEGEAEQDQGAGRPRQARDGLLHRPAQAAAPGSGGEAHQTENGDQADKACRERAGPQRGWVGPEPEASERDAGGHRKRPAQSEQVGEAVVEAQQQRTAAHQHGDRRQEAEPGQDHARGLAGLRCGEDRRRPTGGSATPCR